MKIKLVKNRRKQEVGISWREEDIIGICHKFKGKKKHVKTLDVAVKCRKKVYIEV